MEDLHAFAVMPVRRWVCWQKSNQKTGKSLENPLNNSRKPLENLRKNHLKNPQQSNLLGNVFGHPASPLQGTHFASCEEPGFWDRFKVVTPFLSTPPIFYFYFGGRVVFACFFWLFFWCLFFFWLFFWFSLGILAPCSSKRPS